jgi:hypothetical protein
MSVYGICFDESQSGNCGFSCQGFLGGECNIVEEMIEEHGVELSDYSWEVIEFEYGFKRENYESLWKKQVDVFKEKYQWYKSWLSLKIFKTAKE